MTISPLCSRHTGNCRKSEDNAVILRVRYSGSGRKFKAYRQRGLVTEASDTLLSTALKGRSGACRLPINPLRAGQIVLFNGIWTLKCYIEDVEDHVEDGTATIKEAYDPWLKVRKYVRSVFRAARKAVLDPS